MTAIYLGYFMVILDVTVVNVAAPAIGVDLGAGVTDLQWVVDGYTLAFAALLLTAGSLGDRVGSKRVFQAGLAGFTLSSAACGVAPTAGVLVGARLVQGVAAAMLVPSSLALLRAAYPDAARRARAVGLWGSIAGIAAAGGPLVGGVLVAGISWRAVFFLNVPVGLAALALAARRVPADRGRRDGGLDLPGQLAAMLALAALTFALIEAGPRGWTSPPVVAGFAAFAAALPAFLLIERRAPSPMLPLRLFRNSTFSGATAIGLAINLGFYGQLFVMSLYFQHVRGYSALLTGLALLPEGLLVALSSLVSGRVTARLGPRPPMAIGLGAGALGLSLLAVAGGGTPYLLLVPGLVLTGFGISFTMPAATAATIEAAPGHQAGVASGVLNASRQVGGAIGVALLGTLVAAGAMHAGLALAAGVFLAGQLVALLAIGREGAPTWRQAVSRGA
jgi:DHA2 family methylenomycin A resistance protein-like MFS transporter